MINQPEQTIDFGLAELLDFSKPVEPSKEIHRYHIEVDDDTHWELVRIAAKQKLHQEDFVEQLLVEFVAEHRAAMALIKGIEIDKAKEDESTQPVWAPWTAIEPISLDAQVPQDKDLNKDGCCWFWCINDACWEERYWKSLVANRSSITKKLFSYTHWLPSIAIANPGATS